MYTFIYIIYIASAYGSQDVRHSFEKVCCPFVSMANGPLIDLTKSDSLFRFCLFTVWSAWVAPTLRANTALCLGLNRSNEGHLLISCDVRIQAIVEAWNFFVLGQIANQTLSVIICYCYIAILLRIRTFSIRKDSS